MADETDKETKKTSTIIVDRAEAAAAKLEEQNKIMEQHLAKLTEIETRMVLGGRSEAGSAPAPVKEETPQEYRRRVEGGRFYDKTTRKT